MRGSLRPRPHRLGLARAALLLLVPGCIPLFGAPRYYTDPASSEADAGARRGDADDRSALARLATVPGFPRVADPRDPAEAASIADAAVRVAAESSRGPSPDVELRHSVEFVLRRRRREAFRAIARTTHDPVARHRLGALDLVNGLAFVCRPRGDSRASPCADWPELTELTDAVARTARSDADREVRRLAVDLLARDLAWTQAPPTEDVLRALEHDPDRDVRAAWFAVLSSRPLPPASIAVEVARRLAADDVRVQEYLTRLVVEANRTLLESAYRTGDVRFRRALGNAIFDRHDVAPWAAGLVEQGLFDDDADVRACFAGAVTALDPVPATIRARLEATAPTWESSRTALAFVRARAAERAIR